MRKFGRFMGNVWVLSAPYFRSEEKWSAWGLLLLVFAANFLLVRINVLLNLNGGAWVNALQNYDQASFFRLMLTYEANPEGPFGIVPGFVPLVTAALLIWANGRYFRQWLQIRWRRWLTAQFQRRWLSDRAYYQMQLQGETLGNDNPDQRISEDIADFVESGLIFGFGFFANIVTAGVVPAGALGAVVPDHGLGRGDSGLPGLGGADLLDRGLCPDASDRPAADLAQFHPAAARG